MRTLHRAFAAAVAALTFFGFCAAAPSRADEPYRVSSTSRIKDLANIEGVRQNQLIGYGLVVGLNGTGDTLTNIPFTRQSLQAMLERLGVNIRGQTIRTGNVAAVMVTANLPAFGTQGSRIDVTVSALGDAKSLQGGTLLVTPLLGADGNVYAVGQGSVAISGFQAEGEAAKIVRGVPTVGRISNGAIIEREIEFALNRLNQVRLALRNPDFTTAKRIAAAINDFIGASTAEPLDQSTVQVNVPKIYAGNVVSLLTEIEQLQIEPDLSAKNRHRRTLRRDRDGPRRARLDRRRRAGKSHRHDLRDPAGEPAGPVRERATRRPCACRAPGSACRRTASGSRWCAKAYRCSSSSTGSMRSASGRAT